MLLFLNGEISNISLIPPFSTLDKYPPEWTNKEKTGVPVLDMDVKSVDSWVANFNNIAYITLSKQYLRDSISFVRHHPFTYLKSVLKAFYIFFYPSGDFPFLESNRSRIRKFDYAWNFFVCGQFSSNEIGIDPVDIISTRVNSAPHLTNMSLALVIAYPFLLIYCIYLNLKGKLNRPARNTLWFITFIIIYISLAGNFTEIGENNRFRFMTEPLLIVLLGVFLSKLQFPCL
jgi:hypothetical protein